MSLSQSWMPPQGNLPSVLRSDIRLSNSLPAHSVRLSNSTPIQPLFDVSYVSALQRRALELQQHLQDLLDAQSRQLAKQIPDDIPLEATANVEQINTATSSKLRSGKVKPVRQPMEHVTLTTIRRDVQSTMAELAMVKKQEASVLQEELRNVEATTRSIEGFRAKRKGLEEEVDAIQQNKRSTRLEHLRQEDGALEEQINALELQLSELRSRQRAVRSERSSLENTVQSRLSSYNASMAMLDKDIAEFIGRTQPNFAMNESNRKTPWLSYGNGAELLVTIVEAATAREKLLREWQQSAVTEQVALEEGVGAWSEVMTMIMHFEKQLALYLRKESASRAMQTSKSLASSEIDKTSKENHILELMDKTTEDLQRSLYFVEEKGWNLLICAIGAEVQAFEEGRDILRQSLGPGNSASQAVGPVHERVSKRRGSMPFGRKSALLDRQAGSAPRREQSPVQDFVPPRDKPYTDVDDDEPDPDMLISEQV